MNPNTQAPSRSPEAVGGLRKDCTSGVQGHLRLAVAIVDAQGTVWRWGWEQEAACSGQLSWEGGWQAADGGTTTTT